MSVVILPLLDVTAQLIPGVASGDMRWRSVSAKGSASRYAGCSDESGR